MFRFAPETRLLRQHEAHERVLDVNAVMMSRSGFPATGHLCIGSGEKRAYEVVGNQIVLAEPIGRDAGPALVVWASVPSGEVTS